MSPNVILILQCIAGMLQFIDVSIQSPASGVHVPPIVSIILSGVLFALQMYLQHTGNKSVPDDVKAIIDGLKTGGGEGKK